MVVGLEVVGRLDGDVVDDGPAPGPAVPHEPHPPVHHLDRHEVPLLLQVALPAPAAAGQVRQESVPVRCGVDGVDDAIKRIF